MEDGAELIEDFINQRVWAVVGASTDPTKYGNRIFRDLRAAGYTVYGVNPRGGEVEGQELYPALSDLPEKPAVVDTVVPPAITEEIVRQCAELGLTKGVDAARKRVPGSDPVLPGAWHPGRASRLRDGAEASLVVAMVLAVGTTLISQKVRSR